MTDLYALDELVGFLQQTSRMSRSEAVHVVDSVLAFFAESAEEFVRRRHQELQSEGYCNADIYSTLRAQAGARRFRAPPFSDRQIRRIIYG